MAKVGIHVMQRRDERLKEFITGTVRLEQRGFGKKIAICGDGFLKGGELGSERGRLKHAWRTRSAQEGRGEHRDSGEGIHLTKIDQSGLLTVKLIAILPFNPVTSTVPFSSTLNFPPGASACMTFQPSGTRTRR